MITIPDVWAAHRDFLPEMQYGNRAGNSTVEKPDKPSQSGDHD